ncbi:hypothetical protein D3C80_1702420 [compost metagenome]
MLPDVTQTIFQQPAVVRAVGGIDKTTELLDLVDQLDGAQLRGKNALLRIQQLKVSQVTLKRLHRGVFGEQADEMGLVTRRNLKSRKHHYPMRGQGLAQSIYRRDASMVGDPEYPNIEF